MIRVDSLFQQWSDSEADEHMPMTGTVAPLRWYLLQFQKMVTVASNEANKKRSGSQYQWSPKSKLAYGLAHFDTIISDFGNQSKYNLLPSDH